MYKELLHLSNETNNLIKKKMGKRLKKIVHKAI